MPDFCTNYSTDYGKPDYQGGGMTDNYADSAFAFGFRGKFDRACQDATTALDECVLQLSELEREVAAFSAAIERGRLFPLPYPRVLYRKNERGDVQSFLVKNAAEHHAALAKKQGFESQTQAEESRRPRKRKTRKAAK